MKLAEILSTFVEGDYQVTLHLYERGVPEEWLRTFNCNDKSEFYSHRIRANKMYGDYEVVSVKVCDRHGFLPEVIIKIKE